MFQNRVRNVINHSIIYFAYAMAGIYFFYMDVQIKSIYFLFLMIIFFFRKRVFDINFWSVVIFLGILFIIQKVQFEKGTLYNFIGLIVVFGIPYILYQIYGLRVLRYFINITVIFALISLCFWILSNLSTNFFDQSKSWPELFGTDKWVNESYIFYSTRDARSVLNILRNNGGFWEPGAYATTLTLALYLSLLQNKKLFAFKNLILLISILSTFSTTGYISLFFIYLIYLNINTPGIESTSRRSNSGRIILVLIILILMVNINFVGEKVYVQLKEAREQKLTNPTSGRFFAARKSLIGIANYPLVGNYLVQERKNANRLLYMTNVGMYGFLYLIQRIGILAFFLFVYFIYRGILVVYIYHKHLFNIKKSARLMIIIWLVLMFGQSLYWAPLSLLFFWIGLDKRKKTFVEIFNESEMSKDLIKNNFKTAQYMPYSKNFSKNEFAGH